MVIKKLTQIPLTDAVKLPANNGHHINDYTLTMDVKIDAYPKER
jgi:hypothetical protein